MLEYDAATKGKNYLAWDMIGWRGGDYNRLWFRSEGEISKPKNSNGRVELQGLYGRLIESFGVGRGLNDVKFGILGPARNNQGIRTICGSCV